MIFNRLQRYKFVLSQHVLFMWLDGFPDYYGPLSRYPSTWQQNDATSYKAPLRFTGMSKLRATLTPQLCPTSPNIISQNLGGMSIFKKDISRYVATICALRILSQGKS